MANSTTLNEADTSLYRSVIEQAVEFRAVLGAEGRTTKLLELFDYLLERSTDTRAPKEIEIAMSVFGKDAEFDTAQNSTVRAHIYRLRQRLDAFYAGKTGARLHIPKGEYRIAYTCEAESDGQEADLLRSEEPSAPAPRRRAMALLSIGGAASVLLWAVLWATAPHPRREVGKPASSLAATSFWASIATHRQVPVIAASDFYMLAEGAVEGGVTRLFKYPFINSDRDLLDYLKSHPDEFSKLRDRDIHRVPASVATGAESILSIAASIRSDHGMGEIIPVSQLSQEAIDAKDIIYITHFSQLATLRSAFFRRSGFEPGIDFDEVKDKASGQTFRASLKNTDPANRNGYDYGYLASLAGPTDNHILVVSGIDDAALSRMVRLVTDKQQLDALSAKLSGAKAFEALYRVQVTGGLVSETTLLIARPLADEPARGASR